MQGRHSRFLAGKAATVLVTSLTLRPLSNSQNLVKDQALPALHPVAALCSMILIAYSVNKNYCKFTSK